MMQHARWRLTLGSATHSLKALICGGSSFWRLPRARTNLAGGSVVARRLLLAGERRIRAAGSFAKDVELGLRS
jgi:hypothetical protein